MNMTRLSVFVFLSCLGFSSFGQFTDSNLPIVLIQTSNGSEIPDQPRITATMKIIYRGPGERNLMTDVTEESRLNYNGKILIEIRGSSSQSLEKKQYGLRTVLSDDITNNNVSLLGMPEENDWVLNGLAFDASLIRDYLSFNLSARIGNYAPRQRYCEVVINGDYRGLYILTEKVKVDDNRVDIVKIDPDDNTLPDVSGGYLIKADKVTWDDPSAWTMFTSLGTSTDFIHERPDQTTITIAQHDYIKSVFMTLSSSATNPSITKGFPSIIDVPSFVDFMIINELAANVDAYQFSTYFHKDKNGKLRAGPLWDLNLTYGNDLWFWGLDRSWPNTWQFSNGDNVGPRFWLDLFNTGTFRCYMSKRWNELTSNGAPLSLNSLNTFIDEIVSEISEAAVRENSRWGTVGNHANEILKIKQFLADRIIWMTGGLGLFTECASVTTPPLVISRINYHPQTSIEVPKEEDLEFIEITNTGTSGVPLSGIYFRGTGFVFQFSNGLVLPAGGVIQLANNRATFKEKYGYDPYGQFTRNLSNSGHALVLADAFGNVIDRVEYSDTAPWPEADGNGMYLKLSDLGLDNSLAESWVATDEPIVTTETVIVGVERSNVEFELYPNPTESSTRISALVNIEQVQIHDLQGRLLMNTPVGTTHTVLNLENYPSGFYLVTVQLNGTKVIRKLIKK
jgi:CotH kinase protein/Lamin Tail Domain/Secretion system C-terminal sorting domain